MEAAAAAAGVLDLDLASLVVAASVAEAAAKGGAVAAMEAAVGEVEVAVQAAATMVAGEEGATSACWPSGRTRTSCKRISGSDPRRAFRCTMRGLCAAMATWHVSLKQSINGGTEVLGGMRDVQHIPL